MSHRIRSAATVAFAVAASGACLPVSHAQPHAMGADGYRLEQPMVYPRPAAGPIGSDHTEPIRRFQAHYQAAGRPRFLLFWNAAFSDQSNLQTVKESSVTGGQSIAVDAASSVHKGQRAVEGRANTAYDQTRTERQFQVDPNRRVMEHAESDAWRIEAGFSRQLAQAGVTLVDRSFANSLARGANGDGTAHASASALSKQADFLLEILSTPDAQAAAKHGFRVSMRELATGRQIAHFYSQAQPQPARAESGAGRYVATSRGYELVNPPAWSVEDIGAALAIEVMRALTGNLAR